MSLAIPGFVRRLFRIPDEPEPPPGDTSVLRVFHAGPGYLRYRTLLWAIAQVAGLAFAIPLGVFTADLIMRPEWMFAFLIGGPAWFLYGAQLVLTFFALHLDYEMRWYMLGEDALRIREGVFSVQERTMSYANVQQVSVKRGPLESLLGIGDIEVRSAGGGAVKPRQTDEHRGFFRGVANPEEISDLIRSRVEGHRGAGLGESDAPERAGLRSAAESEDATRLARTLVAELRGLRADLSG